MDQMVYKSHSSVTIFIKLSYKLYWNIGTPYHSLVSISCCINLDHTGAESAHVTNLSYNVYQTLKLLVTHVVLTMVTMDQMVYKSHSSVTIFIKLSYKLYWNIGTPYHSLVSISCCINLDHTGAESAHVTNLSYNVYQTLKLLVTHVVLTLVALDQMASQ